MKIKDLEKSGQSTKIYSILNDDNENPLDWTIMPTELEVIPNEEGHFLVVAKQVFEDKTVDCYVNVITIERISELVVKIEDGEVVCEEIYDQENSVIPAVASECFGFYELYYSHENPQVGIDILNLGLDKTLNKTAIAEDLGYILSDENRLEEAIEAFLISANNNPSSVYIFEELVQLYGELGQTEKQTEYQDIFDQKR